MNSSKAELLKQIQKLEEENANLKSRSLQIQEISEQQIISNNKDLMLNEVQKIAHIGHWTLDLVNQTLKWSDETYRIFGVDPKTKVSPLTIFKKTIHPEDTIMVDNAFANALQNKIEFNLVHRLKLKSGEIKYVNESCMVEYNKTGVPVNIFGIVHDITEHKKTEELLIGAKEKAEENEQRFKAIANQATEGITLTDLKGKYIFVNPAFCKMTGFSEKELLKMYAFDLKADSQSHIVFFKNMERLEGLPIQVILKRKNKTEFYSEIIGNIVQINNQDFVLGTVRDITERKKNETLLIESEQKFRSVLEQSGDGYELLDKDGKYIDVNESTCKMLGYSRMEMLTLSIPDIDPVMDKISYKKNFQLLVGKPPVKFETIHRNKSGNDFQVEVTTSSIFINNKPYMVSMVRDISERRKAEKALLESELKFRSIFENSIHAIGVAKDGYMRFVNPALLDLFGYPEENLIIGKRLSVLATPEYRQAMEQRITSRQLGEKTESKYEIKAIKYSGEIIEIELHISEYFQNEERYVIGIIRDVTAKNKARQTMLKTIIDAQENERRKFAMELHDGLGPLLSAAMLYLNTYIKTSATNENQTALLKSMDSINESINTVREISNNLSPQMLINFGFVDAIGIFVRKINDSGKIFINYKHEISVNPDIETGTSIFRVITELINNTIRHANASKIEMDIKTMNKKKESFISLNYSDNGIGFDINNALAEKKGMGLINIISRIESIKGSYKFKSVVNKGINVQINFFPTSVAKEI